MLEPSAAMDEAAGAQASLSPILNGPASIQQQQEYRVVWPQCSIAYQDALVSAGGQQASRQQVGCRGGGPVEQGSVMLSPAATATAASAALPPFCRMRMPACSSRSLVGMDTVTQGHYGTNVSRLCKSSCLKVGEPFCHTTPGSQQPGAGGP